MLVPFALFSFFVFCVVFFSLPFSPFLSAFPVSPQCYVEGTTTSLRFSFAGLSFLCVNFSISVSFCMVSVSHLLSFCSSFLLFLFFFYALFPSSRCRFPSVLRALYSHFSPRLPSWLAFFCVDERGSRTYAVVVLVTLLPVHFQGILGRQPLLPFFSDYIVALPFVGGL